MKNLRSEKINLLKSTQIKGALFPKNSKILSSENPQLSRKHLYHSHLGTKSTRSFGPKSPEFTLAQSRLHKKDIYPQNQPELIQMESEHLSKNHESFTIRVRNYSESDITYHENSVLKSKLSNIKEMKHNYDTTQYKKGPKTSFGSTRAGGPSRAR